MPDYISRAPPLRRGCRRGSLGSLWPEALPGCSQSRCPSCLHIHTAESGAHVIPLHTIQVVTSEACLRSHIAIKSAPEFRAASAEESPRHSALGHSLSTTQLLPAAPMPLTLPHTTDEQISAKGSQPPGGSADSRGRTAAAAAAAARFWTAYICDAPRSRCTLWPCHIGINQASLHVSRS